MSSVTGAQARVTAPATSANLGPGFDSFGLALELHDSVGATVIGRGLHVEIAGEGADSLPRDETHLVVSSMRQTFTALGVEQPGLEISCRNQIPHGRGLGSSAAAIVSGVLLAERLAARELGADDRLDLASRIEGHPDNVAACLYGGFTIAWMEGRRAKALRSAVHPDVRTVVCIPRSALSTTEARRLLPGEIGHRDAASNAGRAGLLAVALTQRPEVLHAATADRLHQDYRRPAMPETMALVDALREAGLAAVVSGAGPTVLILGAGDGVVDLRQWERPGWMLTELRTDPAGAVCDVVGE